MADADTAVFSPTLRQSASRRTLGCLPSGAHGAVTFSCETPSEDEPRQSQLETCFLCRRHLSGDCDVFMYRGDTPFCSDECRQEQIELDQARETEMSYRRRRRHHLRAASTKPAPASAQRRLYARASDAIPAT